MSSFSAISKEIKEQMLQDYLDGIEVAEIATKYSFKWPRTVYHHLKPLTKEQKRIHMRNKLNREEQQDYDTTK
jgi:transposase-like protein